MTNNQPLSLSKTEIAIFSEVVWRYYRKASRDDLPWRQTTDPYRIVVSEIMLQQTQVSRVLDKYKLFIQRFPSTEQLSEASLGEVLALWQGLGYNRRAKMLWHCAQIVQHDHGSRWPATQAHLQALPGIGPYTAGAVMAFAYNSPVVIIETNIRTVYLQHFFADQDKVSDKDILNYVEQTLPSENIREWYWALMDYGSYLKRVYKHTNHKSKHYQRQSKFIGSDRQIRGAIIRLLVAGDRYTAKQVYQRLQYEPSRILQQLDNLCQEGLVVGSRGKYSLPQ